MLASQANIGMYANITNMDCLGYMIKPLNLTGRKCPHSCWWLDTWNWLDGELNV